MKETKVISQLYSFIRELNNFKSIERLSVIKQDGRRESDAEHTWHLVMTVWLFSHTYDKKLDLLKTIKLALVHDLVELYSGDIYGGALPEARANKEKNEREALLKLCSQLPKSMSEELDYLWNEYEERRTNEAEYVWALDKIMPSLMLTITKTDRATGMPTDQERGRMQREKIGNISPILKQILTQTRLDRGLKES